MKAKIWLWQLVGFAFVSLGGTLLHFLYEWLGEPLWIAPFSGVNESTFEHMKLLFWPCFLFALVQGLFFKEREDFFCVKARGITLGLTLIPVFFYTYNGAIGRSPDWLNITIFFLSALIAFFFETRRLYKDPSPCKHPRRALALLCLYAVLFALFTFRTPTLGLFRDPLTGSYGV